MHAGLAVAWMFELEKVVATTGAAKEIKAQTRNQHNKKAQGQGNDAV